MLIITAECPVASINCFPARRRRRRGLVFCVSWPAAGAAGPPFLLPIWQSVCAFLAPTRHNSGGGVLQACLVSGEIGGCFGLP